MDNKHTIKPDPDFYSTQPTLYDVEAVEFEHHEGKYESLSINVIRSSEPELVPFTMTRAQALGLCAWLNVVLKPAFLECCGCPESVDYDEASLCPECKGPKHKTCTHVEACGPSPADDAERQSWPVVE